VAAGLTSLVVTEGKFKKINPKINPIVTRAGFAKGKRGERVAISGKRPGEKAPANNGTAL
ncbi:hypothetical protein TrRE_jg12816, partial [Triparma retinervis]